MRTETARPEALGTSWRNRATELRRYGAEQQALTLEIAADELDRALRAVKEEVLTLRAAAETSGYSERRIREMIADGTIPQAGRRGAPRVRRGDLPTRRRNPGTYDPEQDAAAILARRGK